MTPFLRLRLRSGADSGTGAGSTSQADEPGLPLPAAAENSRPDDTTEITAYTRKILEALAAIGTFGATLSLAALHSTVPGAPVYLAWAFSCFVLDVQITLVWRAALDADVGPVFRSRGGIGAALAGGFCSVTAGALLVSLSLTVDKVSGVRAAGFTAAAFIATLFLTGLLALLFATVTGFLGTPRVKNAETAGSGSNARDEGFEMTAAFQAGRDADPSLVHDVEPRQEGQCVSPISASEQRLLSPVGSAVSEDSQHLIAGSSTINEVPYAHPAASLSPQCSITDCGAGPETSCLCEEHDGALDQSTESVPNQ